MFLFSSRFSKALIWPHLGETNCNLELEFPTRNQFTDLKLKYIRVIIYDYYSRSIHDFFHFIFVGPRYPRYTLWIRLIFWLKFSTSPVMTMIWNSHSNKASENSKFDVIRKNRALKLGILFLKSVQTFLTRVISKFSDSNDWIYQKF